MRVGNTERVIVGTHEAVLHKGVVAQRDAVVVTPPPQNLHVAVSLRRNEQGGTWRTVLLEAQEPMVLLVRTS